MAQIRDSSDIVGGNHIEIPTPSTIVYHTKGYAKGPVVTFFHDEHADVFNLKCANCHREEGCGRCHEEVGKTHAPPPRTEEEVHRICVECHGDDDCDKCHSVKEMKPSSGSGGSLQLASERLSEPILFPQGPGSPAPVVFRHDTHGEYGLNCSNCHPWLYMMTREKAAPSRVHTAEASERHECSECHDGETAFDIQIDCKLCHRDPRAQPRPPAARALPTVEFPSGSDSPGPVVFSHDTHLDPDTPTCSTCHPDPFTMLPVKADPDLDKRLPMMHEQAYCGRCHNGKAAFNWEDDCMMCHREREEEPARLLIDRVPFDHRKGSRRRT
jgi:c(7)-type cytochrome triheme protein